MRPQRRRQVRPAGEAPLAQLCEQAPLWDPCVLSGACHALLLQKCLVGIGCYGSSAVSAQLSEQCVRRIASQHVAVRQCRLRRPAISRSAP